MKNNIAIIFGITGQIGSYLLDKLLSEDFYIYGVARRTSSPNLHRIKHNLNNENFELLSGDITDPHSLIHIFNKVYLNAENNSPIYIFNMAAQSFVSASFEQPSLTWDITAKGVLNILETIRKFGDFERIKFLQMSSSEMFGSIVDHDNYQRFKIPFKPNSPYGIAKLAAHHFVDVYRRSYGINASCAVVFNNESPRRGEEFVTRKITKWIGEFIANGRTCNHKLMLGNLDVYRDWSHSKDIVNGLYLIMREKILSDYIIASGNSYTIRDFLKEAFNCIGIKNYEDYIEIDRSLYRPCEVPFLRGDASEIKRKLGWNSKLSFSELIKEMVTEDIKLAKQNNYLKNWDNKNVVVEELMEK